jgi:adenylate cyclase
VRKNKLYKIVFLVSFWVFAGIFYELFQGTIAGFNNHTTLWNGTPYHFPTSFITAVSVAFVASIIVASFDVLYLHEKLRRKPLGITLIVKTLCYLVSIFFFSSIGVLLSISNTIDLSPFHFESLTLYVNYLSSPTLWLIMSYWGFAVMLGLSILHVSDKFGQGVLLNFLFGKYHLPKAEVRIFMFLDLTSSSRIAEILGASKYSSFLKDFFYDIDDVVLETKGAIFQFVGDEVVVIWNVKNGVENCNCVRFFFLLVEKFRSLKDYYIQRYGACPDFKAGLHYGNVIITEVGGSKQEIAYHGDTVNTTARIRSVCTDLNKRLLISAELLGMLSQIDENYIIESKGIFNLKGKKNVIALFSVEEKNTEKCEDQSCQAIVERKDSAVNNKLS